SISPSRIPATMTSVFPHLIPPAHPGTPRLCEHNLAIVNTYNQAIFNSSQMQADNEPGCPFLFNDGTDNQIPIAVHYDEFGNRIYHDTPDEFLRLLNRGSWRNEEEEIALEDQLYRAIPPQLEPGADPMAEAQPGPKRFPGRPAARRVIRYRSPTERLEDEMGYNNASQANYGDDEDEEALLSEEIQWREVNNKIVNLEHRIEHAEQMKEFYHRCKVAENGHRPVLVGIPPSDDGKEEGFMKIDPDHPYGAQAWRVKERKMKEELESLDASLKELRQKSKPAARRIILKWYKSRLVRLRTLGSRGDCLDMNDLQRRALCVLTTRNQDGPPSEARSTTPDPEPALKTETEFKWRTRLTRVENWVLALWDGPPDEDDKVFWYDVIEDDDEPVYRPYATDEDIYNNMGYPDSVLNPASNSNSSKERSPVAQPAEKTVKKPTHTYNLRGKRKWISEDNNDMTRGN
ncbi:hypothetical protein KEM56_001588, partial [Ascosphaera pollenicola]